MSYPVKKPNFIFDYALVLYCLEITVLVGWVLNTSLLFFSVISVQTIILKKKLSRFNCVRKPYFF